jgi:hypothetical protein
LEGGRVHGRGCLFGAAGRHLRPDGTAFFFGWRRPACCHAARTAAIEKFAHCAVSVRFLYDDAVFPGDTWRRAGAPVHARPSDRAGAARGSRHVTVPASTKRQGENRRTVPDAVLVRRDPYAPIVIERDGRLPYRITIESGDASFHRDFPVDPDAVRVLRDDAERDYFLFAALHHPYPLHATNPSDAECERCFGTILFAGRVKAAPGGRPRSGCAAASSMAARVALDQRAHHPLDRRVAQVAFLLGFLDERGIGRRERHAVDFMALFHQRHHPVLRQMSGERAAADGLEYVNHGGSPVRCRCFPV